jgi:hypothetical protein
MPLPSRDTPLRLADGRLVMPDGSVEAVTPPQRPAFVEVPTHAEAQRLVTGTRRKLSELPEVPRTMNAVGIVLSYTLFGLDDEEIAVATGLSVDQIGRIKLDDPYAQMYTAVVQTILDAETSVVRDSGQSHVVPASTDTVVAIPVNAVTVTATAASTAQFGQSL